MVGKLSIQEPESKKVTKAVFDSLMLSNNVAIEIGLVKTFNVVFIFLCFE